MPFCSHRPQTKGKSLGIFCRTPVESCSSPQLDIEFGSWRAMHQRSVQGLFQNRVQKASHQRQSLPLLDTAFLRIRRQHATEVITPRYPKGTSDHLNSHIQIRDNPARWSHSAPSEFCEGLSAPTGRDGSVGRHSHPTCRSARGFEPWEAVERGTYRGPPRRRGS